MTTNFSEPATQLNFYEFDDGQIQIKRNQQYDKEVKNGLSTMMLSAVVTAIALAILAVGIPLICTGYITAGAVLMTVGTVALLFSIYSAIIGANLHFQKQPEYYTSKVIENTNNDKF